MSNMTNTPDSVGRRGEDVGDEDRGTAGTLRDEASRLVSGVRQKAEDRAEEGISVVASSLEDFTAAIRKASEELGQRDQSMAAGLVRQAASGLEEASAAISGKSLTEITHSVADFARRQPFAFLVGAALAGVALGRFARASGDTTDAEHFRRTGPGSGPTRTRDRSIPGSEGNSSGSGGAFVNRADSSMFPAAGVDGAASSTVASGSGSTSPHGAKLRQDVAGKGASDER